MASQVSAKQPETAGTDLVVGPPRAGASWATLYRTAGLAALVTAVLVPVQLAALMAYPFPDPVIGWFGLLQDNLWLGWSTWICSSWSTTCCWW